MLPVRYEGGGQIVERTGCKTKRVKKGGEHARNPEPCSFAAPNTAYLHQSYHAARPVLLQ